MLGWCACLIWPAGFCIAFIYNWRIALLVTGAAPLVAFGGLIHVKLTFMETSGSDKLYATANSAVTEAISSIRVIQVWHALKPLVTCVIAALVPP